MVVGTRNPGPQEAEAEDRKFQVNLRRNNKTLGRSVAQWQIISLAYTGLWIQSPALRERNGKIADFTLSLEVLKMETEA